MSRLDFSVNIIFMESEQNQNLDGPAKLAGLTKKERRQARRQEKESERLNVVRGNRVKRYLIKVIILLVVFATGYGFYYLSKSSEPQSDDFSQAVPDIGRSHIPDGSAPSVTYNSNPPTSGEHYGTPARPGFRENAIPDGNLIHSLEHGLVWVSYHPRIGDEADKLRDITTSTAVVVPREANDTDIALAAWGRLDTFNLEDGMIDADDLQRISDFIKRYSNKGPERIPSGQHGGI